MAPLPVIVLVTGSFSLPSHYDAIIDSIRGKGYEAECVRLLSVGKRPGPPPTMQDDAAHVASVVAKYVDEGKDVMLVAHSYGGIPTSQSTKGLTKPEREKEGKKGGVVRLAYLSAVVPDVGFASMGTLTNVNMDYVAADEDGWLFQTKFDMAAKYVFNHLPEEEGIALAKTFPEHSAASFMDKLTHAGYVDVPVSWLFCEDDLCVTTENQQAGIGRIEAASGKKVDVTKIWSDHAPNASHPDKVVEWIIAAAEKGGNWN